MFSCLTEENKDIFWLYALFLDAFFLVEFNEYQHTQVGSLCGKARIPSSCPPHT